MVNEQTRTYVRDECVVFRKTDGAFGGLSNMAGGFPILVNGIRIRTSEALYQACRFPHRADIQEMIINEKSPMTAKMRSKPHRPNSRSDWEQIRVKIMSWCLRMKLANNWLTFSELLLLTTNKQIVEESHRDVFWGAKSTSNGDLLVGRNILGRLLMALRQEVSTHGAEAFSTIETPGVKSFLLIGRPIEPWVAHTDEAESQTGALRQANLFE